MYVTIKSNYLNNKDARWRSIIKSLNPLKTTVSLLLKHHLSLYICLSSTAIFGILASRPCIKNRDIIWKGGCVWDVKCEDILKGKVNQRYFIIGWLLSLAEYMTDAHSTYVHTIRKRPAYGYMLVVKGTKGWGEEGTGGLEGSIVENCPGDYPDSVSKHRLRRCNDFVIHW